MWTPSSSPEPIEPSRPRPDAVVFITNVSRGIIGGIIQYLDSLERILPRHGIEVITFRFPKPLNLLESRGLPKFVRAPLHVLFALYCLARILRLRPKYRQVLVHSHGASYALLASFLARVMGYPAVHTFHSTIQRKSLVLRTFAPKLDALVFASESLHDLMRTVSEIRGREIYYISGAVDLDAFAPVDPHAKGPLRSEFLRKFGLPERGLLSIFVGRIMPEKGVLELVEAVGDLKARGTPTSVMIVGPVLDSPAVQAYFRRIQERVRTLGIEDWVVFTGPVTHPEKERLVAAADIFVCASIADVYPISVVEALSAGVPVVATRVGGLVKQVRDGETGILVEPGNPRELAKAIDLLARSDSLRLRMGGAAREEAIRRFSEETLVQSHLELYAEVLQTRKKGHPLASPSEPRGLPRTR